MILILSDVHDEHADLVTNQLKKDCAEYFRFNLDTQSLMTSFLTYENGKWIISQNGKKLLDEEITTVWFRRAFVELLLEEKDNRENDFLIWKNEWNKVLLGFYQSLSNLPCLCPLKQSYAAENKFYQTALAIKIGLQVPEFIVSNDRTKLLDFAKKHDDVVLKLHHQDFYKTSDGYQGIYVNKVSVKELGNFNCETENPITLQKYIKKSFEVRYTVVGDTGFACRIDSQKSLISSTDWRRYDISNTPYQQIHVPAEIERMSQKLMRELGINYGAFDYVISDKNEWYFLEVNPMGQWLWVQDLTNLRISDAICDWLKESSKGDKYEGICI